MAEGDRVLATAAAAAAAALGAAHLTSQPNGREALQRLFPGCTYLALGVGRLQPATESNAANSEPLLLFGSILLSGRAEGKAAAAAVHLLRGSLAGAAILAGRPLTYQTAAQPGSGGDCGPVAASAWSDTSQAVQLCGAQSFLCLPFRLAGMRQEHGQGAGAAAACGSSGSSSRDGDVGSRQALVVAALLLGLARPAAGQQLQQQQQQQLQGGSQPWAQHLRVLVQLAAALVRHAQPELSEAAEGLGVLLAAAPAAGSISDEEEGTDSDGEASGMEAVEEEREEEAEKDVGEAAEAAAAGGAAAVAPAAVASAEPAAGTASGASDPSNSRPQPADAGSSVAQGRGPDASLAALPPGTTATQPRQQPQPQTSIGSGRAAPAEAGSGPGAAPGARLSACVRGMLLLCHATLAPLLQLLSSRRGMQLDWLLRFREAGPGGWEPPGGLSPASIDGSAASRGSNAQEQQAWAQQAQQALLGPEPLEQQFLRYHARLMADKMDAAGSLILLAILVLLSKEPSCRVRLGDSAFCAVAAVLALPLAALLPGAPRAWYVQRREQVLQLFFFVVLLYQQAVHNFLDSHTSRASQARYVNAGFAWITVDGVLLQMRFCRQLPTLLACFLLNLRAISEVCERFHAHLDPRRCAASGFLRGVLCLLMPLSITYLLELRMRRNWLLRRQAQAAQADAEVQQALRAQRQRERQDLRLARAAGASASSSGQ